MRFLYSLLFYIALPYIFLRLWRRSKRQPEYRQRLLERLGYVPFRLKHCIWVHTVSVGESIAAIPLIKALQTQYPTTPLLITTMTPTGSARVKAALGETIHHTYLPYDLPCVMRRFLAGVNPSIFIIMETELWPNLLAACQQKKIPVCLVNARLSEKSAKGYSLVSTLTRNMLSAITMIAAQGKDDAARFLSLGAKETQLVVTGNIKFDLDIPSALASQSQTLRDFLGKDRFVWIAASTHEGEEAIVLAAHQQLREKYPTSLLILVPRHPDRFDSVAKECNKLFMMIRRSLQPLSHVTDETGVYLGDTMGELILLYGAADAVFVGGSLINKGGHNLLEPAALGKAILTGPSLFNFSDVSNLLFAANALIVVNNPNELAKKLAELMLNESHREAMGKRAYDIVEANRGALQKQIRVIVNVLS